MNIKEFNEFKKYSEASGVIALVDENIHMELNEYGCFEETVSQSDDYDIASTVNFVSPNFNKNVNESMISKQLYEHVENINFDKRIGYYLSLYAGHVREGDYRLNGSSGGMGTWIFKELFENDLIDGVIHVKENQDEQIPLIYKYDISRNVEEVKAGSRTKYYPVELSKALKKIKEVPGRYAVIGIPSFIMAIRLLAQKDEVIKNRIKFTVGLICGHQKSSKYSDALAWQMGVKPGNLKYINFRKKYSDKPANIYGVEITGTIEGKDVIISRPIKELIGHDWGQGYFKVLASDFTDDVMNETADITLGDAWLDNYINDSNGNNVIIVRNPVINEIIQKGIDSEKLELDTIGIESIMNSQDAHYRHTHDELAYRLYKKDKLRQWYPYKRVEPSDDFPFLRKKIQDMREEISTKSHFFYKKAVEKDDLNYFIKKMKKLSWKYKFLYRILTIQNRGIRNTILIVAKRKFTNR
ncbi:coenzyme F420 hydrogenase [Oceanispirochaeta crateris]|uniref:Coenzyme F420 hydrogenase n=1 Tax=Oceanispirochaeta crateris TaxID=2518645 RepID=A0A5C1QKD1_9SPIO|nr:Coenzyme F420 hydrogenase/dehydrogenase, beta subunit C-terminal domain [Oceanispirochaeta crateris]QEN06976.1 coenzyme F420 hydrogenase [Oceanispirochaeta crateris]